MVRALLLQVESQTPGPLPDRRPLGSRGPGRERRCGRSRRRLARRTSNRKSQSSVVRRALPGSSHRSRWHLAGCVHHGSPPHRSMGPDQVRTADRAEEPVSLQGCGRRYCRLRQRRWCSDGRWRDGVRRLLLRQSVGECDVSRDPETRSTRLGNCGRTGIGSRTSRKGDWSGWNRRSQRPGLSIVR